MHFCEKKKNNRKNITYSGFTIVELLVVVVVIAILAAVAIVAYNGVTDRTKASAAQASAKQAYTKISSYAIQNNDQYPADLAATGLSSNETTFYEYTLEDPSTFCLTTTVSTFSYYVSSSQSQPTEGLCDGHIGEEGPPPPPPVADGDFIQTITSSNCPTTRVRAVDARDNRTYWVQELADGKCWMLTNLAYAGGGTNTYGDTKTLANGTGGSTTYTVARYYIPPSGSNVTTEPTAPSTSTTGTGQYGYFYNLCAAMGAQATAACANAATPTPNPAISVCPAGWRLPTSGGGGEYQLLNNAVNGGLTNTDAGLRTTWLGQRTGSWGGLGFTNQGTNGYYWSSTYHSAPYGMRIRFDNTYFSTGDGDDKYRGFAVRCVAV